MTSYTTRRHLRSSHIRLLRRHPWVSAISVIVVALAAYYASIPLFGPHFAEVCSKGEYGPPDSCEHWDAVTAFVLRAIYGLDAHSGLVAAFAGVVIAVFTGVLYVVTGRAADAAKTAANVAERTLSEAYRPYLTVHTISHSMFAESAKTTIYFAISNIGDRAAIINGLRLRLVSADADGVESVLAEEAMDQRRVVKPNREIKVTCRGDNPTGERWAHAKGGEITICWDAAIHYSSPQSAAWTHRARARFGIGAGEGSFEPPIWSDVADDPTGERMIPWPPKSKEQET